MNYNRRTTRPDGMHYRETRKHVGSSRPGRRGRGGTNPVVVLIAVAIVAVVVIWVFRR